MSKLSLRLRVEKVMRAIRDDSAALRAWSHRWGTPLRVMKHR